MFSFHDVTGHIGGECFLLTTDETALLFDSGFDFCADATVANIRAVLAERPLDYILATHSHYDHVSGSAKIKAVYPNAKVIGSAHAAKVLSLDGARAQIRELNAGCAADAGLALPPDRIDHLAVDVVLADGDELPLSDLTLRAVATPGHTRCAMSYHIPELDFLACSETLGIAPAFPDVIPCMIVSYCSTLDAIDRSRRIGAGRILVSHYGLLPEGMAEVFFDNARNAVVHAADLLVSMHDRGCGEEEIVDAFKREYYEPSAELQPERAFDLNTRALIPRILAEFGKTPA